MEAPLIEEWERELAGHVARRVSARARTAVAGGEWSAERLRAEIRSAERRLTRSQRMELWMALIADPELAELAERLGWQAAEPGDVRPQR
jgi:hypothetical protein